MTRLLAMLPARPTDPDAALLGRWADHRDEAAFTELVRRHGPAVWGVCRRQLANPADAEDAFQAAFLVLARRADTAPTCLGAWLHRVAILTCRNVRRANRRRPATALPSDIAVSPTVPAVEVDDLLNRLPERDRRAVVLCHLLGFTRTEAAKQLGIPEGTLSARLSRGLAKLRGHEAALVAVAVPAGLATATGRAVGVWGLSATSVSPAVAGAASGVIRMFWLKKMTAAAVVVAGLVTAGVGVGVGSRPTAVAADPPKATKPPADWNKSAELNGPDGKPAAKLTTRVEKGWVVARFDSPLGRKLWEVVLAQAAGTEPPAVSADQGKSSVAVEYGKYFVRDSAGLHLRVLRQKKADGLPAWPTAKPTESTKPGAMGAGLHLRPGKDWLWVTAGPFGGDWAKPTEDKADVCLRLAHTSRDSGTSGTGRMSTSAGGVNVADYGNTQATDDGELFVASYRPYPPDPKPEPKAEATNPKLLRPWVLDYWPSDSHIQTVATFALAAADGKLAVPPGGWGWQVSDVTAVGDRITARLAPDPTRTENFYQFEGRYDPAEGVIHGCLYGYATDGKVFAADLRPATGVREPAAEEQEVKDLRNAANGPGQRVMRLLWDAWQSDREASEAAAAVRLAARPAGELQATLAAAEAKKASGREAVLPVLTDVRRLAGTAATRPSFVMTHLLLDHANELDATAEELSGWADNALRFAGRYGDRYRDHLLARMAGNLANRPVHPAVTLRLADQAVAASPAGSRDRLLAVSARAHTLERLGRPAEAADAYTEADRLHSALNGPPANPDALAAQRANLGEAAGRLSGGVQVATYVGRVTDPAGRPVAGAEVMFVTGELDGLRAVADKPEPVRTDTDGRYAVAVRYVGRTVRGATIGVHIPGEPFWHQPRVTAHVLGTMTVTADVRLVAFGR